MAAAALVGLPSWSELAHADPPAGERARDGASSAETEARTLFERASQAYDRGDFEGARRDFEAAYEKVPLPELAYNLARVYERMADPRRAVQYYRVYLREGSSPPAERRTIEERVRALGEMLQRRRDEAVKPPPSHSELTDEARTFFERGAALYARGKFEEALVSFGAALGYARLPELFYNMALSAERLGRTRDAVDHYRAYLRAAPEAADGAEVGRRIQHLLEQDEVRTATKRRPARKIP